jgi:pyruvate dehydrogenase E1 component beta subunit
VSVEIVDPRTLAPLDEDLILESVKRTGRCIIADCDWVDCGSAPSCRRASTRSAG